MHPSHKIFIAVAVILLVSLACNIGRQPGETTDTPAAQETPTAEETAAEMEPSETAEEIQAIETPTNSPEPSSTTIPTATATSIPCDLAGWGRDITVPDGKKFNPGENFTKTWELQNIGSCTWTSGYQVVFSGGDQMGAPSNQSLTSGSIAPGNSVQISINMTAPNSPGTYIGNWKLRNPSGAIFSFENGNPFYVNIKVRAFTDTPEPQPDLQINLLELNPATPTKGNPVNVKVQVYNYGNAAAGAFVVGWWPGENYGSPACTWPVASLAAHGGRVLTCVYAGYPSHYPSIVTVAKADTAGSVDESDETNNNRSMTITVNSP